MKVKGIEGLSGSQLMAELQQGAKFVTYQYCVSIIILTFKRSSDVFFIRANQNAVSKGLLYSLIAFLFGWWGIPWGPIYTIEAFIVNFKGGRDVTAQVMAAVAGANAPGAQPASPLDRVPIYHNQS